MAKGMREIKRQVKSTQNMKQITKAMEMVAASKLRRSQEAAQAARPYAEKIKEVVSSIAAGTKGSKNPILVSRPIQKTGYLVITSDRGLAGGYNSNLLRKLMQTIREKHKSKDEYVVFVVGRKGRDFLKKRDIPVIGEVTGLADSPKFADIKELASLAVNNYVEGKYDELFLVYNKFHNAISQEPVLNRLLPLDMADGGQAADYEYEPSSEEVLDVLLPKYAETLIFSALLEAKASEFGAKMTAMGNATRNATEMIARYSLMYNRARQASITQEITEIVAGANAQG
ncbi:F0F1 ATP synthase subunit gamma [Paenibacillus hemerocallicola]|jgi:F-type H+-transporting ATPase subunit gamma|uniref:ATP synthase gamma chain n=1 Tax=Paenibacillus hemerocallicola TaxID=1172614 RepID=A0A5C4T6W4_9BACL|nr:ATP synthase F1 subunit gamma [Paenibacillus hemerocallicola]TNJ64712.1 F0F1 ATP synthase subunit gamma [Paenibacillus hemerocallicola]